MVPATRMIRLGVQEAQTGWLLRFRACRTVWGEKLRGVLSTFASYFLLEENDQWLRTQMQRV